jgi:hypothetical protein
LPHSKTVKVLGNATSTKSTQTTKPQHCQGPSNQCLPAPKQNVDKLMLTTKPNLNKLSGLMLATDRRPLPKQPRRPHKKERVEA